LLKSLLNKDIQDFINKNIGTSISKLALQKNPFVGINWVEILSQIEAKNKAKHKLPFWFNKENIIYPNKISVEQTSSEKTALHKSNLISGKSIIDLTGGFGVDDYFFSKKFETVTHCEINQELQEKVVHNYTVLGTKNINCLLGDSYDILKNSNQKFDWIYVDPSRRNDTKQKVFLLKDCSPNVPQLLDFYFEYAFNILVKTSPLLDITAGLKELKNVKCIHIVAIENEVKELLWEIENGFTENYSLKTINLKKEKNEVFDFIIDNQPKKCLLSFPKKYLYEPNAAVMKSGGFDYLGNKLAIEKLHSHSHLFTSNDWIDFPGRCFRIETIISYDKKNMKTFFENKKMNLTIRNFPEKVENLRKKWNIKEGGDDYCFFTTDCNENKIIICCKKV
jgi:hypothetical protein